MIRETPTKAMNGLEERTHNAIKKGKKKKKKLPLPAN